LSDDSIIMSLSQNMSKTLKLNYRKITIIKTVKHNFQYFILLIFCIILINVWNIIKKVWKKTIIKIIIINLIIIRDYRWFISSFVLKLIREKSII